MTLTLMAPQLNDPDAPAFGLTENIYGHVKRLEWIASHLELGDRVLEIGCGTGFMITLPLLRAGWDVIGVDTDEKSIEYGRRLLSAEEFSADRLLCTDARDLEGPFDAVVLSEVLEHIPDDGITALLAAVHQLLAPGGKLMVTVPNGHGAFEFESLVWNRLGLGWLLEHTRIQWLIERVKLRLASDVVVYPYLSSLDSSPHVQRFTLRAIARLIESAGFTVTERRATVLAAGPITNLLFTGFRGVTRLNRRLADAVPSISTAFMIHAVPVPEEQVSHVR